MKRKKKKKPSNFFTVKEYKNLIKPKSPTEAQEQAELCKWIKDNYPTILYTVDLGGISLTAAQRIVHSTRCKRGHPDMIFQEWYKDLHCGLAVEFKRTGVKVTYKDGSFKSKDDHLVEQLEYLMGLKDRCYIAGFVCGIDNAKKVISAYLEAGPNSLSIIDSIIYPKL